VLIRNSRFAENSELRVLGLLTNGVYELKSWTDVYGLPSISYRLHKGIPASAAPVMRRISNFRAVPAL
jgi:hypothetical protein